MRAVAISALILAAVSLGGLVSASTCHASGIMVWRLEGKEGVTEKQIDSISGFVSSEVGRISGQQVTSEADVSRVLDGEQKRQQCDSTNTSCLVEIGAAMGVPEAVSGDLGRLGTIWIINLTRISVRTAMVVARASRQIDGPIEDLVKAIPVVVGELFGVKTGEANIQQSRPKIGTVVITSKLVGVKVSIGGKEIGTVPLKQELAPGKYVIRGTLQEYEPVQQEIEVAPWQMIEVALEPEKTPPGTLAIKTNPEGALVSLNGTPVGNAPLEKRLQAGFYDVVATLDGFDAADDLVAVVARKTTSLLLTLDRDYPMNPYKKWGYVSFFSGVGLAALGGIATWQAKVAADAESGSGDWGAGDRNVAWTGVAAAGYMLGGAAMITGAVLWILSPGDKAWAESHAVAVTPVPSGNGAVVMMQGRW